MDGITNSMDMNLSKLWETVKDMEVWHAAIHGAAKTGKAGMLQSMGLPRQGRLACCNPWGCQELSMT